MSDNGFKNRFSLTNTKHVFPLILIMILASIGITISIIGLIINNSRFDSIAVATITLLMLMFLLSYAIQGSRFQIVPFQVIIAIIATTYAFAAVFNILADKLGGSRPMYALAIIDLVIALLFGVFIFISEKHQIVSKIILLVSLALQLVVSTVIAIETIQAVDAAHPFDVLNFLQILQIPIIIICIIIIYWMRVTIERENKLNA